MVMAIVDPFPKPPGSIRHALQTLAVLRSGDKDAIANLGDTEDAPRPWDPSNCDEELREALWKWCDDVVGWINSQYVWRPTMMIPICWPLHPHIAQELPALAMLRHAAQTALVPDLAEEWHRYTLPQFMDRMISRLGDSASTCRAGKHADWPAANRQQDFTRATSVETRRELFYNDTHPVRQLRPLGRTEN
jgi:hypothetical protein